MRQAAGRDPPYSTGKGCSQTVGRVLTRHTAHRHPAPRHTADHTTLGGIATGRKLNLEIDVLARYLKRMADARQ